MSIVLCACNKYVLQCACELVHADVTLEQVPMQHVLATTQSDHLCTLMCMLQAAYSKRM